MHRPAQRSRSPLETHEYPASLAETSYLEPTENFSMSGHIGGGLGLMGGGAAAAAIGILLVALPTQSTSCSSPPSDWGCWPSFAPSGTAIAGGVLLLAGATTVLAGAIWLIIAAATHHSYEPPPVVIGASADANGGWLTLSGNF